MPHLRFALSGLVLFALPVQAQDATPIPDSMASTLDTLLEKAFETDTGYQFVEDLTTEVGPRLAGSEAEARARDWAVAELEDLGFDTVRVEGFEIPYWSRLTDKASILSPAPQNLVITALGGSTSTPEGGIEAEIIRFESLAELQAANPAMVEGKIVFIDEKMTRTQDGSGYGMAVRKRRACAGEAIEKGGLACLIRSVGTQTSRFPHTGMMARGEAVGAGPAAALSPPDADQLSRLLERGPVTINLDIQVKTKETAPSGNVIAEITGSEKPEDIILLGCHLDSWDLATGAIDDGAGCGIVVGAAKLIKDLPEPPKRTIRVVLYGSEEVGLLGGRAYAREHAEELPNHIFAAESDFGADTIWQLDTNFGKGAMGHAKAIQQAVEPLGVAPGPNDARGGPDIFMLGMSGVPMIGARQNGWDYFDLHHTPDDTIDKVDPEKIQQNVAVYTAFTYLVAYSDWDLRAPASTTEMTGE